MGKVYNDLLRQSAPDMEYVGGRCPSWDIFKQN